MGQTATGRGNVNRIPRRRRGNRLRRLRCSHHVLPKRWRRGSPAHRFRLGRRPGLRRRWVCKLHGSKENGRSLWRRNQASPKNVRRRHWLPQQRVVSFVKCSMAKCPRQSIYSTTLVAKGFASAAICRSVERCTKRVRGTRAVLGWPQACGMASGASGVRSVHVSEPLAGSCLTTQGFQSSLTSSFGPDVAFMAGVS